jgi:hypothetical protein
LEQREQRKRLGSKAAPDTPEILVDVFGIARMVDAVGGRRVDDPIERS